MQDFKIEKQKIIRTLLFFVILFVLLTGVSLLFERAMKNHDDWIQDRNKSIYRIQKEAANSIDVIVLGDSLSYSSMSPMEMWEEHGTAAFVCGSSGQKIQDTYYTLETVLENQSPKLVILETNTLFRGGKGLEALKDSLGAVANHYTALLRGHDIWKSAVTGKTYPTENYKGFLIRSDVKPYHKSKNAGKKKRNEEIPNVVLTYMEKIKKLCDDNGARLLLVGSPSPRNYTKKRHDSIEEYAKENSLPFLDLNLKVKELGINWKTDSRDNGDHLNLSGAQKVTAYLGNYLAEEYELPDHRGEEAYASWNEESAEYKQKADAFLSIIRR